ncbi:molybdenum cofactor biosynthesis protein MoaE [Enterovirga sp.]|uniref:molybdenum cofactor biosynthesis protein MoaE n=1 Tax=Enterovirga sp. TaxID=2026350 RepID=UPI002CA653B1|nr:molybdenum cofactor biosynthesis protein MoaE [Enterovirga sp.]HMO29304.1 molybdenum cofactor biosynthesis protein MoaE [Enterovirga sp.]
MPPRIAVQREDFDPALVVESLSAGTTEIGAVATFLGLCRSEEGRLAALELEHYPGMAEEEIGRVAAEAAARWPLLGLCVVHRYGLIRPGERIVIVAAAARHRGDAFAAAAFLMDFLKTRAPFWKREHLVDGTLGPWVAATEADAQAAASWERNQG